MQFSLHVVSLIFSAPHYYYNIRSEKFLCSIFFTANNTHLHSIIEKNI